MKVIVVYGYSGAGKTTVASYIAQLNGGSKYVLLDSIAPLRQMYEKVYNLPEGSLNTYDGKYKQVPDADEGFTFQSQLVSDYHYYQKVNPFFAANYVYNTVRSLCAEGKVPVLQSIRAKHDIAKLEELANQGYKFYSLRVSSDREVKESSDESLVMNGVKLRRLSSHHIHLSNNSSFSDLHHQVKQYVDTFVEV